MLNMFKREISGFAHHGVPTVGGRSSALADDFFEASLVDRCIAFWATQHRVEQGMRDVHQAESDLKC